MKTKEILEAIMKDIREIKDALIFYGVLIETEEASDEEDE